MPPINSMPSQRPPIKPPLPPIKPKPPLPPIQPKPPINSGFNGSGEPALFHNPLHDYEAL